MVRSYINLVFRRLRKERLYSIIKVAGLATAFCCAFLIYIYVSSELRYDRHNIDSEQLYRVIQLPASGSDADRMATTPFPLHGVLENDLSHLVSHSARLFNQRAPKVSLNYIEADRQFNERQFFFADSTFFHLFDVTFVRGDAASALSAPNGLVMTRPTAERYFGDDNPIGKTIRFEGRFNLVVTAVVESLPSTSHVQFDMLASFASVAGIYSNGIPTTWDWNICWTYIRAQEGVTKAQLDASLENIARDYADRRTGSPIVYVAQPVTEIRLHSDLQAEIGPVSDMQYIRILSYIGLFILIIAAINFVNLSLAGTSNRTKEVGMRKVLGAERSQIFWQYLGESLIVGCISLLISVVVIALALPYFGMFIGQTMGISTIFELEFWLFAILAATLVTAIAGVYPSVILASWSPMALFRPTQVQRGGTSRLSKTLIVMQFAIAAILISGTWIVYNQLNFLKNERLGFEKEQVVVIPASLTRLIFYYDVFSEQVKQHHLVQHVTGTSVVIGTNFSMFGYEIEGFQNEESVSIPMYFSMPEFDKTYGINIVAGRFYDPNFSTDPTESVLVNEAFIRRVGWGNPQNALGKQIRRGNFRYNVIGVMEDFNFDSLHKEIDPLVIEHAKVIPTQVSYIAVKLAAGDPSDAIDWMRAKWHENDPNRPFEYFFLDDRLEQLYENEQQLAQVAGLFSLVSIIISCFGLFGLASYTTQKQSKSIGIRKVMGASVSNIVMLLAKEFMILVIIANAIAIPLVFLLMGRWLEDFAYRVQIDPIILFSAFFITVLIAFLSVSYQTIRAATRNPIDSIRYE